MTAETNEDIYKRLAEAYALHQGESLLAEQQVLDAQGMSYLTPRADAQVRQATAQGTLRGLQSQTAPPQMTAKRHRSRRTPLVVAAAACLLLVVVGSTVAVNLLRDVFNAPNASMSGNANTPDASVNGSGNSTPSADSLSDTWSSLRPLGFALPARFSLITSEFDNGMSIYRLADANHDEVVLTMQQPDSDGAHEEILDTVYIDGKPVPAKIDSTYKLLRFEQEGVEYTLSSRASLEALVALYVGIVE